MQDVEFVNGLLDFINNSPTPFHAVKNMSQILELAGFQRLLETEQWSLQNRQQGERFYVTRNDSSIIAFQLNTSPVDSGIRMLGAHTDSPCLKVKPNPEIINHHYLQLGVEVYGGALLNPWFDRDLSLAGRVSFLNDDGAIDYQLINLEKAIAIIPSLAIHLDREANAAHPIDAQKHLPPVLMKLPENEAETKADFREMLLKIVNANAEQDDISQPRAVKILDYELSFYDVQPPAVIGLHDDFIAGARLDNLLSCYTGLAAMLDNESRQNTLLVCNDHEEVGSISAAGAQGTLLKSVLERMCERDEDVSRMIANSVMISADNAHGVHPNYADKHDANHGPVLNMGPVIKVNANQRYASNSETAALFRYLCELADVPVQSFVVRSDMACGSTIGPITASALGVKTVDVGVPTFAMHSIRELAGRWDTYYLYRVFKQYYNQ
ncbi:MAG: M18 family aminopeptidase [Gammaproteobacteria bacterium]|nr:M18 family aminopeptidase [Gammaproteobacteria bacterium]